MTGIGIIGFGFMGRTHLQAYADDPRAEVVAIADARPEALAGGRGGAGGNLPASAPPADLGKQVRRYASADELLADPAVEAVSICVPTPDHPDLAIAALRRGKHVLVEKPLALTIDAAERVARAARGRPDLVCLPAHCMRHWPGWDWLKARVVDGTLGRVQAAFFQRMGPAPGWAQDFYRNPDRSGGAILDLHIHDADFVRFCFGAPASVQAVGFPADRDSLDHIMVTYGFENGPPVVVAEGAWVVAPRFPFVMRYRVHFDRAIATFDLGADHPVTVYHADGRTEHPELAPGSGYTWQARHFLDRIERGADAPPVVTIEDGVEAVRLVERERATMTSPRRSIPS